MLLNIEKLIYGGDGLARLPADERGRGKAVFVPFVLAGEKIEATLTEQKASFARAKVESIVEASPHRVQPGCRYFAACGGCHYQHASYAHQLEIKKEILRENLRRIAKLELSSEIQVHPSPPWNYRNRSRLQVQGRPEFAAGYFKFASHELLPVEECPISSPLINQGIAALWRIGRAGKVAEGVVEVEFFADADDTQLLIEVSCTAAAKRAAVKAWAEELRGLAGVGLFSTALARDFHHIVSVEASQTSASDLKYNLPSNGEVIQATAEQYLSRSGSWSSNQGGRSGKGTFTLPVRRPDLVVVDPPRSGLGESVARSVASLDAPRITYVACDPATLARDLIPVLGAGYRVEEAHLVDLFPQTYHLETVLHLGR